MKMDLFSINPIARGSNFLLCKWPLNQQFSRFEVSLNFDSVEGHSQMFKNETHRFILILLGLK